MHPINLHSHTLHCLGSAIAVSIKLNRPWRPLRARVEFPRVFRDVCKSHIHDFFWAVPPHFIFRCCSLPQTAQMKVKWRFLREKYCLIVKLKLPLQDGTWNAPSSAWPRLPPPPSPVFLYSLHFICKAHWRPPKRYPEWMHYWETVCEQLLIQASDKESRAVWNLKKKKGTGESHGAYRPGRSPAAKEGPEHPLSVPAAPLCLTPGTI